MALALSLSLDLFLMKGNLFIAVRSQPETDRQVDGQAGKRERQSKPRREAEGKKNKRREREKKKEGRTEGCD